MPGRKRLRPDRLALGLLAAVLAGCAHETPLSLPAAAVGRTEDVPIAVVTGRASGLFFLSAARHLGDATTDAAVRDARSKMDNDGLINATVERRELCFPACSWPLVSFERTIVTGTLVRYHKDRDFEAPKPPARLVLAPGAAPPIEDQARRLEDLFGQDPTGAEEYFASLSGGARDQLRDFILSKDGVLSSYDTIFKAPRECPDERRRFLQWFVPKHTAYQLVFEER